MEEGRCYAVGGRGCDGVGAAAHGVCVFFRLRRKWEVTQISRIAQISFACGEMFKVTQKSQKVFASQKGIKSAV